jgi:hypothetical protein
MPRRQYVSAVRTLQQSKQSIQKQTDFSVFAAMIARRMPRRQYVSTASGMQRSERAAKTEKW